MNRSYRKLLAKGFALSAFALAATFGAANSANAGGCTKEQGRQYCTSDALKLCSAFVPNETKIEACLKQNVAKLSPDCKKCFSSFEDAMGWTN
jgi:hypothetical protein